MSLRLASIVLAAMLLGNGCASPEDETGPKCSTSKCRREVLDHVDVLVEGCFSDGAKGTVTNNTGGKFSFKITATFWDDNGEALERYDENGEEVSRTQHFDLVDGQTTAWSVPLDPTTPYETCTIVKGWPPERPIRPYDQEYFSPSAVWVYDGPAGPVGPQEQPNEEERTRLAAEAKATELANLEVVVEGCFPTVVRGSVTNRNEDRTGVSIQVKFLTENGTLIDRQHDTLSLSSGETDEWQVPHFHTDEADAREHLEPILGYARCRVEKGRSDGVTPGPPPSDVAFVYAGEVTAEQQ